MNKKFDFDDIQLVPSESSRINSRSEVNVYDEFNYLPIISAPMDTVYFGDNTKWELFENDFHTTIPRDRKHVNTRLIQCSDFTSPFISISLTELESINRGHTIFETVIDEKWSTLPFKILVDIANGHMESLEMEVKKFKKRFPNEILMVGNVANPKTYRRLSEAGADYIRISIGSGSACLTSVQTAVGYPMASLISECYKESFSLDSPAKIVADGGFRNYSDFIKGLALGADYIMTGSVFNKAVDIGGDCYWWKFKIRDEMKKLKLFDLGFNLKRPYRGMSTKDVQKDWGRSNPKTAEGISKMNDIEYTLCGWKENFISYLSSAMSYTNSKNLTEFKGSEYVVITDNALKRFKK